MPSITQLLSSKTVWAGLVGIVITILQFFHHGINLDPADQQALVQTLTDVGGGVASLAAIIGRVVANGRLSDK